MSFPEAKPASARSCAVNCSQPPTVRTEPLLSAVASWRSQWTRSRSASFWERIQEGVVSRLRRSQEMQLSSGRVWLHDP